MKSARIPYLGRHLQKLNNERERRRFPFLLITLCLVWTLAVWFIAKNEQEYAREVERVQSINSGEKTISTPSLKQINHDPELRFTF